MLKQKQKITHLIDELLHYVLETEPGNVVITIQDWENDPFEAATRLAKSNGVSW